MPSWPKSIDRAANPGNGSLRDNEADMQKALKDTEKNFMARISLESEKMMGTVKNLFKAGGQTLNDSPPFSNSTPTHHNTEKAQVGQHEAAIAVKSQLEQMRSDHVIDGQSNLEKQDSESCNSTPNARKRKFGERPSQKEDENQHLKVLLAATEEKLREAEKSSQASATQAQELEKKNKKLYEQMKQHKSIILESGRKLTEEVPDEKIRQDFVSLRGHVQHIVHEFYRLDTKIRPRGLTDESPEWLNDLAQLYDHATDSENLRKRFRGLLFGYMNTDIFGRPLFGIQSGYIQDALSHLEEKMLEMGQDNYSDIVEWRVQTMKCISLFDDGTTEARNLAKITYYDLKPFMRGKSKSGKECFDQLTKLYTDAQNLALFMRSCKHSYKVEVQNPGDIYNGDESISVGHWDFGNSNENSEAKIVHYLVSGALVKYPKGNLEHRIVLERGHLVTSTGVDPERVEPERVESQERQE